AAAILGVDAQGKPTALLARPAHGLTTVSLDAASRACERWRERAAQDFPRPSAAGPSSDSLLNGGRGVGHHHDGHDGRGDSLPQAG
ncbi:MAG: hypothetical protein ACYC6M_16095, partial [Terriglobales bacterium]